MRQLSAMAMVSGLANAMVLAVINSAAGVGHEALTSFRYVLLFAVTVTIYIRAQSYLMTQSATVVESILNGMRSRFVDLIRRADRLPLDTVGRSAIYAGISGELAAISQATTEIVTASQASIMVVCAIAYLSILSWTAFLITLCVSAIGISIHFQKARERQADIQEIGRAHV